LNAISQRVVIVHVRADDLKDGKYVEVDERMTAHCFGPFDSHDEAVAFEDASSAEDDCIKISIPIVGPGHEDMFRTEIVERRHAEMN
jgi:hypothetical protein